MKKSLLTTIIGSALAVSAMAQGTINFDNYSADFLTPIYGPNPGNPSVSQTGQSAIGAPAGATVYGGALLQGTRYEMDLFAGTVNDPNTLTLVTSGTFQTSADPSSLPAGLITTVTDVPIPGVAAGASAFVQVRVWDTTTGTSYANAGSRGASGVFSSGALGGIGPSGPVLPPDLANGLWTSFSIAAVPEPGTFALAGLGAAALLIFRRRK